jgi:hypothetical protein
MQLEIGLPSSVIAGQPVPIEVRLVNAGDLPRDVVLQGRPTAFDIAVTRPDGTPIWRRLEQEVVTAILQLRQLAPRETLRFRGEWDQRDARGAQVPPGDYLVSAELPSDPPAAFRSEAVRLRIRP